MNEHRATTFKFLPARLRTWIEGRWKRIWNRDLCIDIYQRPKRKKEHCRYDDQFSSATNFHHVGRQSSQIVDWTHSIVKRKKFNGFSFVPIEAFKAGENVCYQFNDQKSIFLPNNKSYANCLGRFFNEEIVTRKVFIKFH